MKQSILMVFRLEKVLDSTIYSLLLEIGRICWILGCGVAWVRVVIYLETNDVSSSRRDNNSSTLGMEFLMEARNFENEPDRRIFPYCST